MLDFLFHIFSKNDQLNKIKNFLLIIFVEMGDKLNFCCQSRKIEANPILPQQQWWGNDLMLLTPHSAMRKQKQRTWIIAQELDNPMQASSSNFLATI